MEKKSKTLEESVRARIGKKAWRNLPPEKKQAVKTLSKIRSMGKIGSNATTAKRRSR